ncbi:unnamed protein product [Owenia fusiformis]|uniref:galactosylceramidase n=1 Tax=Owenia fusiformis TaxID=6347 RepID=A0A8J1T5S6_OWEFU|nr:unnamed protein product [Owenia fusiformis]
MYRFYSSLLCSLLALLGKTVTCDYIIDASQGLGRMFDGIGGISGGGATSKLLVNYPKKQRDEILDYLFKPNYAASLQILKVEIGGDSQSTDGSESSHMHTEEDENYQRGYEWFMMKEAKKRNPDIILYGLPWVFPGWLGGGKFDPFSNRTNLVRYTTNWVKGAKREHNLTINYVGVWNERTCDYDYIKMLRKALDVDGFNDVKIVACDGGWGFIDDVISDQDLADSINVLGAHYPGSQTPSNALRIDRKLWASEEYSAYNDDKGGGCWARILNEGYTDGFLTAFISWNLISSYYKNLPYSRSGLMTADEPWSGHYTVNSPIWISAHHTQFYRPGWQYLLHGYGVGNLALNGSYISLISPDHQDLTVVIETMDPNIVTCFYPQPKYNISSQTAVFNIGGKLKRQINMLYVWRTRLTFDGKDSLFQQLDPIKVIDGKFILHLNTNEVYTLSTIHRSKQVTPAIKPSGQFPTDYSDDFEDYPEFGEPYNFAQQAGVFEVRTFVTDGKAENVMQQVVPEPPIDTCLPKRMTRPITLIGNYNWTDADVSVDFNIPTKGGATGVFVAQRVETGGCNVMYSSGVYLWLTPPCGYILSSDYAKTKVYDSGWAKIERDTWYTLRLQVQGNHTIAYLNGEKIVDALINPQSTNGFIGVGTENFANASFNNFKMQSPGPNIPHQYREEIPKRPYSCIIDKEEYVSDKDEILTNRNLNSQGKLHANVARLHQQGNPMFPKHSKKIKEQVFGNGVFKQEIPNNYKP